MYKQSVQQKRAGLNEAFPRSDPLLQEFAAFLQVSGAAAKDIDNKVIHIIYITWPS